MFVYVSRGWNIVSNEYAMLNEEDFWNEEFYESYDIDELEENLQSKLEKELLAMEFLNKEREQIGNPENLGNVIMGVVWDQFLQQIASSVGDDFIKENGGLTLDLRSEAHIQTTENFAKGKIAKHNTKINHQERYDNWQSNLKKDENGNVMTHMTRSGRTEATLNKGARKAFDEGRPSGSAERKTDMDHTVSAGEIIRDPAANAHLDKNEQIAFANSAANLNEMDSSWNRSKGDKPMKEWLDNPNANGQKPSEVHNMSKKDEQELRKKDEEARKEYEKAKKEGEKRSIELGKQSQIEETILAGSKMIQTFVKTLLAQFAKKIFLALVQWLKSAKKSWNILWEKISNALHSFTDELKKELITASKNVVNLTAKMIIGPIFDTLQSIWNTLKQFWKSLKEAFEYLNDPTNKGKSIGIMMMEIGKIIIAGLTGAGAIGLGALIETALHPLLGHIANIIGIFLGAVISGVIGAIAINAIDKIISKKLEKETLEAKHKKANEILNLQHQVQFVRQEKLDRLESDVKHSISERHELAANEMEKSVENIRLNCEIDGSIQDALDDINSLFDELED